VTIIQILQELETQLPRVAEWCISACLSMPILRPGCSAEELQDVAASLACVLPPEYRDLLSRCREFRAGGPGPGVHLFSPYSVVAYCQDSSTPNRLTDSVRCGESQVITIGLYEDSPLLLEVRGSSVGQLLLWPRGEEVRFDGSSAAQCEVVSPSISSLLTAVSQSWAEGLE